MKTMLRYQSNAVETGLHPGSARDRDVAVHITVIWGICRARMALRRWFEGSVNDESTPILLTGFHTF
jgi:hypothetical protein